MTTFIVIVIESFSLPSLTPKVMLYVPFCPSAGVQLKRPDLLSKIAPSGRPEVKYVRLSPSASDALTVKVRLFPGSITAFWMGFITGA